MGKRDKETKTPSTPALRGKHDINLALRPFFVLHRKCTSRRRVRRFRIGDMEATLEVKAAGRLPWFRDMETLMALITVAHHQVETGPKVFFSPYAVLGMMGKRQDGGLNYDSLHHSLDRLLSVTIKGHFKFKGEHGWTEVTEWNHLLDSAYLAYATDEQTREVRGQRCWVRFSALLWRDIVEGNLWTFDWEKFQALEGGDLVKALYIHIQVVPDLEWEEDIFQVAAGCGLVEYEYPSQVRRLLDPALEKLVEQGILADYQWVTRGPYHRIRFSKRAPSALIERKVKREKKREKEQSKERKSSSRDLAMATGLTAKEKRDVPWELAKFFALRWSGWAWPPPSEAQETIWREFARKLLRRCGGDITGIKAAIDALFDSPDYEWEREHFTDPDRFLDRLVVIYNQGEEAKRELREKHREKHQLADERFTQFRSRPKPSKDEKLWQQVLEMVKGTMTKGTFQTYLKNTKLKEHKGDTLVIEVANEYALDWIAHRLVKGLKRAVKEIFGPGVQLAFVAKDALVPEGGGN